MHTDTLELSKRMIGGNFLPKKYFHVDGTNRSIQSLAYIPTEKQSVIFVGTDHGLFRTIDSGKNWIESKKGLFNQDIRALAVDRNDSQVIYAGTPKGVFKSEDRGKSWNEWFDQASGLTNTYINDLLIDPNQSGTIYAATQGGLFVSHEGGDLWESTGNTIPKNEVIQTIQFSAAHPEQLITNSKKNIFRSTDDRRLWERKWTDLPKGISSIITLKTDPEFIFIGTEKGFYKSFNGGLNWIKDKNKKLNKIFSLAIDTTDNSGIFLSSAKGLFYSNNSGDTWLEITPHKYNLSRQGQLKITQINKILVATDSYNHTSLLLAGSKTGLFISDNNGSLWNFVNLGESGNTVSKQDFKMDLGKLVTEIHTGRFFGEYFYWVVDIATIGMIGLAISGLMIISYRKKIKLSKNKKLDDETEVERIIEMPESFNKENIYKMTKYINTHLKKYKSIYKSQKTKGDTSEIDEHIAIIDSKIQIIVKQIKDFSIMSQNASSSQPFPDKTNHPYNPHKNLKN
jgi:photosystem II stability/assembly factor-like uncharacterized protein